MQLFVLCHHRLELLPLFFRCIMPAVRNEIRDLLAPANGPREFVRGVDPGLTHGRTGEKLETQGVRFDAAQVLAGVPQDVVAGGLPPARDAHNAVAVVQRTTLSWQRRGV